MTTRRHSHSYLTLASIAALAFIGACVSHEVIAHGGMCLALGRRVTLLTSVYFRCSNSNPLIDAAGPLMNLTVGAICAIALRLLLSLSTNWRLFLLFSMAFNLFWGSGYFIFSAVANKGDWAFVLRDLALQPIWLWRKLMGALGVYLYYRSILLVAFYLPQGTPLVLPYLVAGAVSCLAALFFAGPILPALRESAQESFVSNIGLLLLAYRNFHRFESASGVVVANPSNEWVLTGALITLAFFATLGRGFVFGGHA
jgi:hypothetical protein